MAEVKGELITEERVGEEINENVINLQKIKDKINEIVDVINKEHNTTIEKV